MIFAVLDVSLIMGLNIGENDKVFLHFFTKWPLHDRPGTEVKLEQNLTLQHMLPYNVINFFFREMHRGQV